MTLLRLIAIGLTVSLVCSCSTAGSLAQEPVTLVNDVFSSVGRLFHSSANDRQPGDNTIEAKEVQKAEVALKEEKSQPPSAAPDSTVAAR
jgi:hypothetical protein